MISDNIRCNGTMMDILDLLADKHHINYSLVFNSKDGLNEPNGGHIVISPYSFKVERFLNFDYGFPFITSPEFIYSMKPKIQVESSFYVGILLVNSFIFRLMQKPSFTYLMLRPICLYLQQSSS